MFTFLDLLVVVFLVLAGLTVISVGLMFLLKNQKAKRICFYVVLALTAYTVYAGLRMGISGLFTSQITLSIFVAFMIITAIVLERISKNNEKLFLKTRILSTIALVLGFANVFFI